MAFVELDRELHRLRATEERILDKIRHRQRVARNIHELHQDRLTIGQRAADRLAAFAGSWPFIFSLFGFILLWVGLNLVEIITRAWDPYPFILLNLFLSLLAGLQAPVIMMSQNRQESRDRIRAENDYEVNLKAELEIEQLHEKVDGLRERQWRELLEIQKRQIALLEEQIALLRNIARERPDSPVIPGVANANSSRPASPSSG